MTEELKLAVLSIRRAQSQELQNNLFSSSNTQTNLLHKTPYVDFNLEKHFLHETTLKGFSEETFYLQFGFSEEESVGQWSLASGYVVLAQTSLYCCLCWLCVDNSRAQKFTNQIFQCFLAYTTNRSESLQSVALHWPVCKAQGYKKASENPHQNSFSSLSGFHWLHLYPVCLHK